MDFSVSVSPSPLSAALFSEGAVSYLLAFVEQVFQTQRRVAEVRGLKVRQTLADSQNDFLSSEFTGMSETSVLSVPLVVSFCTTRYKQ